MNNIEWMKTLNTRPRDAAHSLDAIGKGLPKIDFVEIEKANSDPNMLATVDLPVKHHFSLGIYGRELLIPKHTCLTGQIHKYPQMNILLEGEISVLIGNRIERIKAPYIVCSPAGTKRVAFAHEESIWLTIHATQETELDKIEDHFIAKTEQEFLDFITEQERLPLFESIKDA